MSKKTVTRDEMAQVHKYIPEAYDLLEKGRITRREFMRTATLLGMSVGVATVAAACGGDVDEGSGDSGGDSGDINKGGTLIVGMELGQVIDHPARLSWIQGANVVRQVGEYLTFTGPDNITVPWLLEEWSANDDVTEWTLKLREGIKFNDGTDFNADAVIFSMSQWFDPEVGSSILGLMSYLDGMNGVEKVDDYTVKLTLMRGSISVPEDLFHYPGIILPPSFEGDFIKQPIGTGPFTLEEFVPDERAVLKRRDDYWGGPDGNMDLPYLDEVRYVNLDKDASLGAIQSGEIHTFYQPRPSDWETLKNVPGIEVGAVGTAQTLILRMRLDTPPWDDIRVYNALKMCQDREQILQLAFFGEGDLGRDAHIAPIHPAYAERDIPGPDIEGARALLEEWAADTGNELPLKAVIVTKNDEGEAEYAQVLQQTANQAGFDLSLDITEPGGYWERWDEVPLGITAWTHRPLATMVLALAYIADAEGNPVPWNETRWTDEEFGEVLVEAQATLDVEARRELIGRLQDISYERGPLGVAFFKKSWRIARDNVNNIFAHPTGYDIFDTTWLSA